VAKLSAVALIPMFLLTGLVFPLVLAQAGRDMPSVGVLAAVNGIGGWLGTMAYERMLGPWLGLWLPAAVWVLLYGLLGWLLAGRWSVLAFSGLLALGVLGFGRGLPQAALAPGEKLHALRVNPEGVVATVESAPDDWRMLFNNSYTLGGSKAQFNQERQALLPMLLHPAAKAVGLLGLATGSTAAGAALLPGVESIEAAELSPAVFEQARKHFGTYNRGVLDDPRVTVQVEDARWIAGARPGAYDVVAGDLFLPWRTGEGRLFSLEHFRAVRRTLKPGGLFCQWLPLFQLTEGQFQMILATFTEVFPGTLLLRGDFYTGLPIIGLAGNVRLETIDWENVRASCASLRAAGAVKDPLLRHAEGVAMLLLGPAPRPAARLNTLANAALELDAGRNIIGLRAPWFTGVPQAGFFQTVHRAGQPLIPPELRAAHDAGQYVLTLEIAARTQSPLAGNLKGQFAGRLPRQLLEDKGADWRQWPGAVKPERNGGRNGSQSQEAAGRVR